MSIKCERPEDCRHITSYLELKDHPMINGVELVGNRLTDEFGLQGTMLSISIAQIEAMFDNFWPDAPKGVT